MKKSQCGTEFPACIRRLPFRASPFLVRCGAGKDTEPALQKGKQDCQLWGGNLSVYGAILSDLSVWHTFGSVLSVLPGTWKTKIQTI